MNWRTTQQRLNNLLGTRLVVDGIPGPLTRQAVEHALDRLPQRPPADPAPEPEPEHPATGPRFRTPYDALASHLGLARIPGPRHEPIIVGWLESLASWLATDGDETAWCGAAAAFACDASEHERVEGWKAARALEWQHVGLPIARADVQRGDCVALTRRGGGHVAFFHAARADGRWDLLGGNQGGRVSIAPYSLAALVAVRRLRPLDGSPPRLPRA